MFYCHDCRKENGWPESFFGSYGSCELCKTVGYCNDVKSAYLPPVSQTRVVNGVYVRKCDGEVATLAEIREDAERYRDWEQNLQRVTY